MRAELHFLGLEVDLLTTETSYSKPYQWEAKGIPAFFNQGGLLQFFFAYGQKHNRFLERMTTIDYDFYKLGYPLDGGKVVFYGENDDVLKSWEFKDAAIQKFKVTFNANGGCMVVEMLLSPAIQDYGCKVVRHWRVTPIEEETYRSPVHTVEEAKKKECTVEFDAQNSDLKNGVFGFDKLTDKLLRICDSDKTALKKEYGPIKVGGEDYYPPWASIRKGQTIVLKVKPKFSNKDEYKNVVIEDHPDFTFEPKDLKDASEIRITCNNTNENTAQVKVIADGKDAGAINFFYPEPKTIDLRWVFVEIQGGNKNNDLNALEKKISKQKLISCFKKSLNPALIDISIQNQIADVSDISSKATGLKNGGFIKKDKVAGDYIELDKKEAVLNFASGSMMDKSKLTNGINVYFFNLKCIASKNISTNGAYDMSGGLSPTGQGDAYLVLDDNKKIEGENISHEVMHAIDLFHTFKENPIKDANKEHTFDFGKTKNYMDYKNSKQHTFKYQWEKLHKSKFAK